MDNRVVKFLTEIMNGTEPNTAIENSGFRRLNGTSNDTIVYESLYLK